MDWDDFMKIPGCATGEHSEVKLVRPTVKQEEPNAPQQVVASSAPVQIQPAAPVSPPKGKPQVEFRTTSGNPKCRHAGCMKEYDESTNSEESCTYHEGSAGFRDTKKFWSCCGASSYDWDDFMKIPTCKVGKHEPKMIDA